MTIFHAISVSSIYFLYIFNTILCLLLSEFPQTQDSRTRLYSSWRVLSLPEKSNRNIFFTYKKINLAVEAELYRG